MINPLIVWFCEIFHTYSFSCLPSLEFCLRLSDSHRSDEVEAKRHPRAPSASAATWTCRQRTTPRFPAPPSWSHCSPDPGSVSGPSHSSCPWWLWIFRCLHSSLSPVTWPTPRFFPTLKLRLAAVHCTPHCSMQQQQAMDDTAVTAISAASPNSLLAAT